MQQMLRNRHVYAATMLMLRRLIAAPSSFMPRHAIRHTLSPCFRAAFYATLIFRFSSLYFDAATYRTPHCLLFATPLSLSCHDDAAAAFIFRRAFAERAMRFDAARAVEKMLTLDITVRQQCSAVTRHVRSATAGAVRAAQAQSVYADARRRGAEAGGSMQRAVTQTRCRCHIILPAVIADVESCHFLRLSPHLRHFMMSPPPMMPPASFRRRCRFAATFRRH